MPLGAHLLKSRNAKLIGRYQNRLMLNRASVAEHMWNVAKIAQGLAIWEINKFGNEVDMGELLQRAINHDLVEIETGDILSTTKRAVPEMRNAVNKMEYEIFHNSMIFDIPKSWQEDFERFILKAKDTTIEGKIIAAADIIDTIFEAVVEIQLGNIQGFTEVMVNSTNELIKSDLDSVKYFLKYSLQDLGINIQRDLGIDIYMYIQKLDFSDKF